MTYATPTSKKNVAFIQKDVMVMNPRERQSIVLCNNVLNCVQPRGLVVGVSDY